MGGVDEGKIRVYPLMKSDTMDAACLVAVQPLLVLDNERLSEKEG